MMRKIIIYVSLFFISLSACKINSEKNVIASLKVYADTAKEKIKQYEGFQAGGGDLVEKKQIEWSNANCSWDSNTKLTIQFLDTLGYVDATISALELPEIWKGYSYLRSEISNTDTCVITISIRILGARNVLFKDFNLLPGKTEKVEIALFDLPLTARNLNPYKPNSIRFEGRSTSHNFTCNIRNLEIVQTSDTLPKPVVDEFGQRIRGEWKSKIHSEHELMNSVEIEKQFLNDLPSNKELDEYGGWTKGPHFKASGFFRVEKKDSIWWFVTPQGNCFYSLGVTGVRSKYTKADVTVIKNREFLFEKLPPKNGKYEYAYEKDSCFSFYCWNILRKYGSIESWQLMSFLRLKKWGMNTVGNWSEESLLRVSNMPFTKSFRTSERKNFIQNGRLCDVYNPAWQVYVDTILSGAADFKNNAFLLGYFVDNEQNWESMNLLDNLDSTSFVRKRWLEIVQKKYQNSLSKLNNSWNSKFNAWSEVLKVNPANFKNNEAFKIDLEFLYADYAETYFSIIKKTLLKYDPNHLYLSCRFTRAIKPDYVLKAASKYSDVITVNVYSLVPDKEQMSNWYKKTGKPLMIGEHHLPMQSDRQLPPKYRVFKPEERFVYYQDYERTFAKMPFAIGSHWYQYVDQHITGRAEDGENQTVGLVDITDQPYEEMINAVIETGKNIYKWHSNK